jgi:hypothetical protein
LLRAIENVRSDWRPRAGWDVDQPPVRPVLVLAAPNTEEAISQAAAEGASRLAEIYEFPAEHSEGSRQKDLNYSSQYARQALSDIITEEDRSSADLWAALFSDAAARDGRIEATPPARGRSKKTILLTPAQTIHEALFEPWTRQDPTPGFRWDPAEDVRYALRAEDPSGEKSTTQHGANRLAALGLPIFRVVPVQRGGRVRLQILAGHFERDFSLAWPIWQQPASLAGIRALLSHPDLMAGATALRHLGVVQVRRARRINNGRFMNFARAESIG